MHNEEVVETLKELVKNPWAPVPEWEITEEEQKVEKINEEVEPENISIRIGKILNAPNNVYLTVVFSYGKNKVLNERLNKRYGEDEFGYKHCIKLDRDSLSSVYKQSIELMLVQTGM